MLIGAKSTFISSFLQFLYALLTGLAAWALSDTANNGDSSHYTSCELEAQGKIRAGKLRDANTAQFNRGADNRKLTFHEGHTTVIVEDSTSYHCSFGLYTEELKFSEGCKSPSAELTIRLGKAE